jgi:hypothetical protein
VINVGNDREISDFGEFHEREKAYLSAVGVGGVRR